MVFVCRPFKMKNNITLSTITPCWPDKAEREKYVKYLTFCLGYATALEAYFVNLTVG